ncbi:hypothetical protein VFC49_03620 [Thermococcus sp. SY098]|uniref:hypothetical protein n=1 Tax=Thermococcus sp. SY098 TaxID=3111325 RepID=UPI002D76AA71|nr:hypothetical protein [Thermococcus sp. SY098]WRS53217.1 hypothetical protein VFC49_03620 [Thermococcus sp. SY098]
MKKFKEVIMENRKVVEECMIVILLSMLLLSPVSAHSTAWCEDCHQVLVANEGLFAYNGSDFIDLTWHLEAGIRDPSDIREFISNLGVTTVGDVVLVYSNYHDSIYMGIYNGSIQIRMKPVVGWYSWKPRDFVFYSGSVFFVAETGSGPHYASDSVFQLNPRTLKVEKTWSLAWNARNTIAPENAGNTPYAWVHLGLDDNGKLWAKVDMIFPNTTVYYLYDGTNFVMTNETLKLHPYEPPNGPFKIEIQRGLMYYLPKFPPVYGPTRYILIENDRRKDVTDEIKKLAESVEPLYSLIGFWNEDEKEWVVVYDLYGLPLAYEVKGNCTVPLEIDYLPLASYLGYYVVLGNGTLSWKNYTVKTPMRMYFGHNTDYPWRKGYVSLELYQKNGHPVIVFPWEIWQNQTWKGKKGYLAYEITERGFVIINTTDKKELGKNLIPSSVLMGKWNNVTGTLIVNIPNKTAFLITDKEKIPVNFTVAKKTESVVVGNSTFLFITYYEAFILPPWMKPVSVNRMLELYREMDGKCLEEETGVSDGTTKGITFLTGIATIVIFVTLWRFWKKKE